jgi:translocator protein
LGELASTGQLRASLLRWALVTVPLLELLGLASGRLAGSGNAWFAALEKPGFMPPASIFPVAWTILFALLGMALAIVLNARGAPRRGVALVLFAGMFAGLLAWSPLFFAWHRIWPAFGLILAILAVAIAVAIIFGRIRRTAGLLIVPLLLWLGFAAALNYEIGRRNPDADGVAGESASAQIDM